MGDWHLTLGAGVYLDIAIVALLGVARQRLSDRMV